uniref:Uncharacterized protein n=1 Tax=Ascaris lumbricoides TaxID=6252 RepID=A0A9J2PKK5_ASCLU
MSKANPAGRIADPPATDKPKPRNFLQECIILIDVFKGIAATGEEPRSVCGLHKLRICQSEQVCRYVLYPPFLSAANAEPCLAMPMRTFGGMSRAPIHPQRFGFFDIPSIAPQMKRVEAGLKPLALNEVPIDELSGGMGIRAATIAPPLLKPPATSMLKAPVEIHKATEADIMSVNTTTGMNEIFAKMVWKKLNMIKDPVRLARMHTCLMGILQQAITEEATGSVEKPQP